MYCSSFTGSHHSLDVSSPGTSTAKWLNQLSFWAPCQCLTFAGIVTTSPGFKLWAGFPSSWYQPFPSTHTRICPPPFVAWCICQLFLQPGSNVTLAIGVNCNEKVYLPPPPPPATGLRRRHQRILRLLQMLKYKQKTLMYL